jgi:hypothetical protein
MLSEGKGEPPGPVEEEKDKGKDRCAQAWGLSPGVKNQLVAKYYLTRRPLRGPNDDNPLMKRTVSTPTDAYFRIEAESKTNVLSTRGVKTTIQDQTWVRTIGFDTDSEGRFDVAGHVIANQFGGGTSVTPRIVNIVPMGETTNLSPQKIRENELQAFIDQKGCSVCAHIHLDYGDAADRPARPTQIHWEIMYKGPFASNWEYRSYPSFKNARSRLL